jgi:hypothetical protein
LYDLGSLQDQENQADRDQASGDQNSLDGHEDNVVDHEERVVEGLNHFRTEEVQDMEKLIGILRDAHIGDAHDNLDKESIHRLRNPPEERLSLDDRGLRLSIDIYNATQNASQDTYNSVRDAILRQDDSINMLSFHQVKKCVADLTGVVSITNGMCPNSCLAYVGPYADYDSCPTCGEDRYDPIKSTLVKKVPRQQFHTIPIGPQLQALWRSPEGSHNMQYLDRRTKELLDELRANNGKLKAYDDTHGARPNLFCEKIRYKLGNRF